MENETLHEVNERLSVVEQKLAEHLRDIDRHIRPNHICTCCMMRMEIIKTDKKGKTYVCRNKDCPALGFELYKLNTETILESLLF